ncbi:MBL fold metallo-hydrolase [Parvularcula marina]|nr:MBL fold metallo-hydrolase [Parvularcula marina]
MRKILCSLTALGFLSGIAAAHPSDGEQTTAHFLANEGVMIVDGETKILFDPLFRHDYANYQNLPDDIRAKLFAGEAPYDGVDVVFISHAHGDHFTASEVNDYLAAQPQVLLVAPTQAVAMLRQGAGWEASFEDRITVMAPEYEGEPNSFAHVVVTEDGVGSTTEESITASAVRIPHAGGARMKDVENIVYRVTLNEGATVMHLGDAAPEREAHAPQTDFYQKIRTHMAFVPDWFFAALGGEATREMLNADKAVGIHVQVVVPQGLIESGEDYFSKPGETRAIMYGNPN